MFSASVSITPFTSSPRKAYVAKLLHNAVHHEKRRLKTHGQADKLDYCTCTWCFQAPSTYQDPASLSKPTIFKEIVYTLGVSCMHLKVRYVQFEPTFGLEIYKVILKILFSEYAYLTFALK